MADRYKLIKQTRSDCKQYLTQAGRVFDLYEVTDKYDESVMLVCSEDVANRLSNALNSMSEWAKLGGKTKSVKKTQAAKVNGKLGGRPRLYPRCPLCDKRSCSGCDG